MTDLAVRPTPIPGLLVLDLPLHRDQRGWFKENWQRKKMMAMGLPDFAPVQHNLAVNDSVGVTRGLHGEPWDKLVSVATGRVFGAWVDLREGQSFGRVVTLTMGPETAVFVPAGVANAYQVLEPGTTYSYLVNEHWSAASKDRYSFVSVADPALAIEWPIGLEEAVLSDADRSHPLLADVMPVPPRRTLVIGAGGQLGRALLDQWRGSEGLTRAQLDLEDPTWPDRIDWRGVDTIVNAAAYTAVDAAEGAEGRRRAWSVNVAGLGRLVDHCRDNRVTLVHVSSDYVFDGSNPEHVEDEPLSPLGVYGQTKAAGDALVATLGRHYLVRTSWVVGRGRNFVATMAALADQGVSPRVVDDQFGRLTFTEDLAAGLIHLVSAGAPYGTYNLSNSGPAQSWADIAEDIFALRGRPATDVIRVSTAEYERAQRADGKVLAPRPTHSALSLAKISSTGFDPAPASDRLATYVRGMSRPGGDTR